MAIRHLPVVGSPMSAPAPLRKIAIREHFVDPAQVHPNIGDTFSGEFVQEGSSYGGFNPEFAEVVSARLRDLRGGRIEEMGAAGIDYPYDMAIETAPISENDRRKICYGNAAALFGLPR